MDLPPINTRVLAWWSAKLTIPIAYKVVVTSGIECKLDQTWKNNLILQLWGINTCVLGCKHPQWDDLHGNTTNVHTYLT